jgi:hypothetical protein
MTAGWQTKLGYAIEGSWAEPARVTRQTPLLTVPLTDSPEDLQIFRRVDAGGVGVSPRKYRYLSGDITSHLLYWLSGNLDDQFRAALGQMWVSGSSAYFAIGSQPPSLTVAADYGGEMVEYAGSKMLELTVLGAPARPVALSARMIMRAADGNPEVNTSSSGWEKIATPFVMFEDLTVEIGDSDGAYSEVEVVGFDIAYRGDFLVGPSRASGEYIREPMRRARTVEGTLTFPSGSSYPSTLEDRITAKTLQKIHIGGARSDGGTDYAVDFYLPRCCPLKINRREVAGENRLSPTLSFRALLSTAAPSGFPSGVGLSELYVKQTG